VLIRCAVGTRYAIGRLNRLARAGYDRGRKQAGKEERG
jgi:hypothetical protein